MIELLLLFISILLVVACGIFVAGEFSLLALNRNSVEALAKKGDLRAKGVLGALSTLSTQLSSAQVGITVTNLLIGYLAEPAIAQLIRPALLWMRAPEELTSGIAIALGLVLATAVTMIFGELVPKNLAIAKPYKTAALVQPLFGLFTYVMRVPIRLLNGSANVILHRFGVEPNEELASARSADELLSLVRRSAEHGTLPRETAAMLERSLNFGDLTTLDSMTPRLRVKALSRDAYASDILVLARETGFSRFPVYGTSLDDVCGVVHVKHAFAVPKSARKTTKISEIMVEPLLVPSSISLEVLLDDLRGNGLQMAIAVDEFGAVDGVITIEDLLEELVGDLKDEHDKSRASVREIDAHTWEISGLLRPDELAEATDMYLPEHDEVETIAGLVAHQLERIPEVGNSVTVAGVDREGEVIGVVFTVLRMDKHRVDLLRVEGGLLPTVEDIE